MSDAPTPEAVAAAVEALNRTEGWAEEGIAASHSDIATLRRALATLARALGERARGWQPMDTAPRDGTVILCRGLDKYEWGHDERIMTLSWSADRPDGEPYWRWVAPGYTTAVLPYAWMPIPPDPDWLGVARALLAPERRDG